MSQYEQAQMIKQALNRWATRESSRLVGTKAGDSIVAIESKICEHKLAIRQLAEDQHHMLRSAIAFEDIR